ncbi:hypothetical protein PC128_g24940, partial [Phytophthora cactorum]
ASLHSPHCIRLLSFSKRKFTWSNQSCSFHWWFYYLTNSFIWVSILAFGLNGYDE